MRKSSDRRVSASGSLLRLPEEWPALDCLGPFIVVPFIVVPFIVVPFIIPRSFSPLSSWPRESSLLWLPPRPLYSLGGEVPSDEPPDDELPPREPLPLPGPASPPF